MGKVMAIVVGALLVLATVYAYNKFSGSNIADLGK